MDAAILHGIQEPTSAVMLAIFQLHCTSATPSRLQSMMRRLPSPAPAAFRPRNMNIHKRFSAAARHAGVGVARSRTPPIGRRITRVWAGRVAAVTFYLSVPGSFDLCRRRRRRCREFVNHLASWRASLHRVPPHCCAVLPVTVNFTPRITAAQLRRDRAQVALVSRFSQELTTFLYKSLFAEKRVSTFRNPFANTSFRSDELLRISVTRCRRHVLAYDGIRGVVHRGHQRRAHFRGTLQTWQSSW